MFQRRSCLGVRTDTKHRNADARHSSAARRGTATATATATVGERPGGELGQGRESQRADAVGVALLSSSSSSSLSSSLLALL